MALYFFDIIKWAGGWLIFMNGPQNTLGIVYSDLYRHIPLLGHNRLSSSIWVMHICVSELGDIGSNAYSAMTFLITSMKIHNCYVANFVFTNGCPRHDVNSVVIRGTGGGNDATRDVVIRGTGMDCLGHMTTTPVRTVATELASW